MKGKVSERLSVDANIQRTLNRNERFKKHREALEAAQKAEQIKEEFEEFEELDYLKLYPQPQRAAIIISLTAPPPNPLPPLDVTTISYYRRLSLPVFQTRIPGTTNLDPHLTHESLHLLSMLPETKYPNFAGLTKEFERDLRLYLSAQSKDIRTMAVIAAGNRIIGREREVLGLVKEDEGAMWVLFNHVISEKISYQTLLPYILSLNPVAFRAFYEFSNVKGEESIAWFFENEEVLVALMEGLQSSNPDIRGLTLRIFGNVLGEEQVTYVETLIHSPFLERMFRFLMSEHHEDRKDGLWVLANFCSSQLGADAVMRNSAIMAKLQEMLYYERRADVRKELAFIFSSLVVQADRIPIFQFTARRDFLEVMAQYLGQADIDLTIATLSIVKGLINLGEQFKDQNEVNVVSQMLMALPELMTEIQKGQEHENSEISQASNQILNFLGRTERMDREL